MYYKFTYMFALSSLSTLMIYAAHSRTFSVLFTAILSVPQNKVRVCVCVCVCVLSCFRRVWTVAHPAALSMGFSRHASWSGLPFPSPQNNVCILANLK